MAQSVFDYIDSQQIKKVQKVIIFCYLIDTHKKWLDLKPELCLSITNSFPDLTKNFNEAVKLFESEINNKVQSEFDVIQKEVSIHIYENNQEKKSQLTGVIGGESNVSFKSIINQPKRNSLVHKKLKALDGSQLTNNALSRKSTETMLAEYPKEYKPIDQMHRFNFYT